MSESDDRLRELDVFGRATDPERFNILVAGVTERVRGGNGTRDFGSTGAVEMTDSRWWTLVGAAAATVGLVLGPWNQASAGSFEHALVSAHGMSTEEGLGALVRGLSLSPEGEMTLEELVLRWEADGVGTSGEGRTP